MLDLDRLFMNAVTAESAEGTIDSAGIFVPPLRGLMKKFTHE